MAYMYTVIIDNSISRDLMTAFCLLLFGMQVVRVFAFVTNHGKHTRMSMHTHIHTREYRHTSVCLWSVYEVMHSKYIDHLLNSVLGLCWAGIFAADIYIYISAVSVPLVIYIYTSATFPAPATVWQGRQFELHQLDYSLAHFPVFDKGQCPPRLVCRPNRQCVSDSLPNTALPSDPAPSVLFCCCFEMFMNNFN